MLEIIAIPALKDNYIWLGVNHECRQAFVVDPGDAAPVVTYLENNNIELTAILATHKHADHTAGIKELIKHYPDLCVYAHPLENISFVTNPVQDCDEFTLSTWPESFKVMHIPGHTLGHVAYYTQPNLFSGDTLFSAGCGRIFEGTAEQMLSSLDKLARLPDETLIYCGHEYTLANLRFASQVEIHNQDIINYIKQIETIRDDGQPSLPSIMAVEKKINPFLRCREDSAITSIESFAGHQLGDTVSVFYELREWKNKI